MRGLSEAEVAAYVALGEGIGKAGGYAIQGKAALFVAGIEGDYTNVVGTAAGNDRPDAGRTRRALVLMGFMERRRYTIKELPPELRPRERLLEAGPRLFRTGNCWDCCSGSGTCTRRRWSWRETFISEAGGLHGLYDADAHELMRGERDRGSEGLHNPRRGRVRA
jgi:hypothetical protein